jgi:hypothetical protein
VNHPVSAYQAVDEGLYSGSEIARKAVLNLQSSSNGVADGHIPLFKGKNSKNKTGVGNLELMTFYFKIPYSRKNLIEYIGGRKCQEVVSQSDNTVFSETETYTVFCYFVKMMIEQVCAELPRQLIQIRARGLDASAYSLKKSFIVGDDIAVDPKPARNKFNVIVIVFNYFNREIELLTKAFSGFPQGRCERSIL